jgi:hypothetical protein
LATWSGRRRIPPNALLIPFAFLYFLLFHSIVESAGKYHVITIGVLCVLLPLLVEVVLDGVSERNIGPRRVLGLR